MSSTPSPSIAYRLMGQALVLACCLTCVALTGAAKAHPVKTPVARKVVAHRVVAKAEPKTDNLQSGQELLHDATPAIEEQATIASATIPGLDHKAHTKTIWMVVTAYCGCKKCCGPHAQGLTASGRSISYNEGHFVAADARLFKFGAKLQIPGYANGQIIEVIDRGGAIKGYHLDVFFPTHEEARQWGKRWIPVTVVE
ncbi:MAG TPA: 3D domain-containing protein [Tepidisphaeraceae bacterium]|nr:3D domain-containing protein [Tepidisphaeraceae bacterium]